MTVFVLVSLYSQSKRRNFVCSCKYGFSINNTPEFCLANKIQPLVEKYMEAGDGPFPGNKISRPLMVWNRADGCSYRVGVKLSGHRNTCTALHRATLVGVYFMDVGGGRGSLTEDWRRRSAWPCRRFSEFHSTANCGLVDWRRRRRCRARGLCQGRRRAATYRPTTPMRSGPRQQIHYCVAFAYQLHQICM